MSGYIEKRGPDTFRLVVDLPRESSGKRERKTRTFHGSLRDAKKALASFAVEVSRKTATDGGEITFREFVETEYLPAARNQVGAKTYERYVQVLTRDVLPHLGGKALEDVVRRDVQAVINAAVSRGRADSRGKALSPRTVVHIFRVTHRVFVYAMRVGRLDRNPAQYIDLPRIEVQEPVVPDVDDIPRLLAVFAGTKFHLPVLLAVTTGMRRGEVLGLQWRDVDFDAGLLTVARSLGATGEGAFLKEPKTRRSRRTMTLPAVTLEALRRTRETLGEPEPEDFVVRGHRGGYWHPNQFSSEYARALKETGFTYRFHDLRHAHASQLLALGTPVPVVSARLGYCDAATTLRVYAHVLPGQDGAAVEALDGALAEVGLG